MASWDLQHLQGNTWYISAPVNVGLYDTGSGVILLDSGNDKEAGRQIRKILDEKNWSLSLIVNTHSNADHIGGNEYLKKITRCRAALPEIEDRFTAYPFLEPSFLWGGHPFKALRNKFLMAKASSVDAVISSSGRILDTVLEAIPLPGHYLNMIGVRTPDNIVFLADALFGEDIIKKYRLVYLYDVQGHLDTLAMLEQLDADLYVPSHASPRDDITGLIEVNRRNTLEIADAILQVCKNPAGTEDLLKGICDRFGIRLDHNQYVLVGSTLRSYLSYLDDRGSIVSEVSENRLVWSRVT